MDSFMPGEWDWMNRNPQSSNIPGAPEGGAYGARSARLKRQRQMVDLLRQQAMTPEDVQMFGNQSSIYGTMPAIRAGGTTGSRLIRALGMLGSTIGDNRTDVAEGELDTQARDEAAAAQSRIPTMLKKTIGRDGQEIEVPKTAEEWQADLAEFSGTMDPSNPYQAQLLKRATERAIDFPATNYRASISSNAGGSDAPLSAQEFSLAHPDLRPGTPEYATEYGKYLENVFRGNSATRTAGVIQRGGDIGNMVVKNMEFNQNPSKETAMTAAKKSIMDNSDAYVQQYGDQAQAAMQRDLAEAEQTIMQRFQHPSSTPGAAGMSAPATPAEAVPGMSGAAPAGSFDPRDPFGVGDVDIPLHPELNSEPRSRAQTSWSGPTSLPSNPVAAVPRPGSLPPPVNKPALEGDVARSKARGTATGEAVVALPVAEASVARAMKHLDDIARDPMAKKVGTAGYAVRKLPAALGIGTPEADFEAKVKQSAGDMMRGAYEAIRGTGPITDKEMLPLMAAMTRVSSARTPAALQEAIVDAKQALQMTLEIARKKADQAGVDSLVNKYRSR